MNALNCLTTLLYLISAMLYSESVNPEQDNLLERLLTEQEGIIRKVFDRADGYGVQLIYTMIDRDQDNSPILRDYKFNVDPGTYFYPASMVKLPVALLALERLNKLNIKGLSKYSLMLTDSAFSGQTHVGRDAGEGDAYPCVARYVKKIFLVSDNDAFNRLYEFLGPDYINGMLHDKGYVRSRIVHRLSLPLSQEENRYTNPVRFYDPENNLVYQQGLQYSGKEYSVGRILLGEGYMLNDSLITEPMDFSGKNFILLEELHHMLISLIFPGMGDNSGRFDFPENDREFLLTCMSMYPRESSDPQYGEKFGDNYGKFLMFADRPGRIPENIRIFNKIGLAYGFLVESAYIVDFEEKVEFFLSAVINVNSNRIYNDGIYDYDSIGFPFMGNVGRMVYDFERKRERPVEPDLSDLVLNYAIE